jgi:hypothetical protein
MSARWPLLTHNEAAEYLRCGSLPENFDDRLRGLLEFADCGNCGGVRCMHLVMRDWWSEDIDKCGGNCCPDCGDYYRGAEPTESASTAVEGFGETGQ